MLEEDQLRTEYARFIHLSKYARWNEKLNRRETWTETIQRYVDFFQEFIIENHISDPKSKKAFLRNIKKMQEALLGIKVVPSMRALKSAGKALSKHHAAGYNCAFVNIDHPYAFDEILYLSCCGTGNGFSVELKHVSKLPTIPNDLYPTNTVINVPDSKIGWASSLRELIALLYAGKIPKWDVSKVRPYGAPLKTFGGRASGPQPLVDLFEFVIKIFTNARGRKLTPIECHDLVCKVGLIAESGGTRRAALISLSDLSDTEMKFAKSGNWFDFNPQRSYANNSVVYNGKPEFGKFVEEWLALYRSNSGERGILNLSENGFNNNRRDWSKIEGTNPCGEIRLRSAEFCNLSEVIVRPNDTYKILSEKVKIASFIGTMQSCLTDFKYIRSKWQKNCEEERLLGVSLTGIMDNPLLTNLKNSPKILRKLKEDAINENKKWAKVFGINESVAVTTTKPSGNTSQLTDTASGIHPRYSPFYIRTVRSDKKDPLTQLMIDQGIPHEDCVMKPNTTTIFSFPMKSPKKSIFRNDYNCMQQLELWKMFKTNWAEHNISITVYVKENEWLDVASWVYKNFDIVSGLSFLPYDGGVYKQAPYQEITEEQYHEFLKKMPKKIDWSKISDYEKDDQTTSGREAACVSGVCEL